MTKGDLDSNPDSMYLSMHDRVKQFRRAFVLLSGGVDSTTALYMAMEDFGVNHVSAISVDYGQKHKKEIEAAKKVCDIKGISHQTIKLPNVLSGLNVMLTDPSIKIPDLSYSDIKGISPTYVPFRNATLLSVITAHAQKYVLDVMNITKVDADDEVLKDLCGVYFGAHAEDAFNWAYPDCTPEFIGAMANAIYIGTYRTVRLYTPLMWMKKHQIVETGHKLGVPLHVTWSCYAGDEKHCGVCPTCRARKEAFDKAGVHDATEYAA